MHLKTRERVQTNEAEGFASVLLRSVIKLLPPPPPFLLPFPVREGLSHTRSLGLRLRCRRCSSSSSSSSSSTQGARQTGREGQQERGEPTRTKRESKRECCWCKTRVLLVPPTGESRVLLVPPTGESRVFGDRDGLLAVKQLLAGKTYTAC